MGSQRDSLRSPSCAPTSCAARRWDPSGICFPEPIPGEAAPAVRFSGVSVRAPAPNTAPDSDLPAAAPSTPAPTELLAPESPVNIC